MRYKPDATLARCRVLPVAKANWKKSWWRYWSSRSGS